MEARHGDDKYCSLMNNYKLFGVERTFTSPSIFIHTTLFNGIYQVNQYPSFMDLCNETHIEYLCTLIWYHMEESMELQLKDYLPCIWAFKQISMNSLGAHCQLRTMYQEKTYGIGSYLTPWHPPPLKLQVLIFGGH